MRTTFLLLGLAVLSLAACVKPPEYPIEPELTFLGLSRDSMVQGATLEDSILVRLGFTDGDGDITPDAESTEPNVFVVNRRTNETVSSFKLDPIDEPGAENGISGDLTLVVFTTCCDYPDFVLEFPCTPSEAYPVDTLELEAFLIDRAGNESNRVALAPVFLICNR